MSEPAERRPRFSMIRSFALADVITLGNGACGAGSILALMQYMAAQEVGWLWCAVVLFVALVGAAFFFGHLMLQGS